MDKPRFKFKLEVFTEDGRGVTMLNGYEPVSQESTVNTLLNMIEYVRSQSNQADLAALQG